MKVNLENRQITLNKSEILKILSKIKKMQKTCNRGEIVEILFNEKGKFTGHKWQHNNFYTISNLERNGDFIPCESTNNLINEMLNN